MRHARCFLTNFLYRVLLVKYKRNSPNISRKISFKMEFYRTSNSHYGTNWVSTQGNNPQKTSTQVGTYRQAAETEKF